MTPDTIAQAVVSIATPLVSLITFFSRRKRLRSEIRENLSLLVDLDKDPVLKEHSPASMWLRGKIVLDVAKLSGQPLGTPKKPIPKGSVIFAVVLCAGLSYWTYYINRNGLVWYSSIPAVFAFLSAVSVLGNLTDREIPPSEEPTEGGVVDEGSALDPTQNGLKAEESLSNQAN